MDERKRFQRRYDEGYDLHHDERYNLWLNTFHPAEDPRSLAVATPPTPSTDLAELDLSGSPSVPDGGETGCPGSGSGVMSGRRTAATKLPTGTGNGFCA